MEHHLIILVVELCRWIDRLFQKTLQRAVPDLETLLADPRGTFAGRDVVIGPAKRYFSGLILGLLAGLIVDGLVVGLLFLGKALDLKVGQGLALPFIILMILLPLFCLWLVYYLLRGGRMVLSAAGVDLEFRSTIVHCPWALFNTPGQPFKLKDRVLLPVAPEARPFVEVKKNGILQVGDKVNTRPFRFKSTGEGVLYPLYEVNVLELAEFLLQLGRGMSSPLPDFSPTTSAATDQPEMVATPAAAVEEDGWITVRLTRLAFPPFCCQCGTATEETRNFRGFSQMIRIGKLIRIDGAEHARFPIPVCVECQHENRASHLRAIWLGILIGAIALFLAGLGLFLWIRNPPIVVSLMIFLGLIEMAIGAAALKKGFVPVELERYSASRGTIAIRFRWREYGERLVAFLEAQETHAY